MKTVIYYFTGTGNSLVIAKDLVKELGGAELVSIARTGAGDINLSADRTGIVFPVYVWGMPVIVSEFIKRLKGSPEKYIFAVANYGGFPAGTLPLLATRLKENGLKLSAGFGIKMPGNYTPMYGALPEEKQAGLFRDEKEKVKSIALAVSENAAGPIEKNNFFTNLLFTTLLYSLGISHMREADKKYRVLDKCNSCGICYKVCPVQNIKMESGKPVWLNRCEQCMACLQCCPVEAIQYGKATEGRKRYRHPDMKIDELYQR